MAANPNQAAASQISQSEEANPSLMEILDENGLFCESHEISFHDKKGDKDGAVRGPFDPIVNLRMGHNLSYFKQILKHI